LHPLWNKESPMLKRFFPCLALLGLLAAPLAVPPARTALGGGRGPALIGALQGTGLVTLATGVLLGLGLALSG
jgi:1,4-dihydroxy-2-naphthoate octaprenyltransferase